MKPMKEMLNSAPMLNKNSTETLKMSETLKKVQAPVIFQVPLLH